MEKELKLTADGSKTIYLPAIDEHYHSTHGAYQEAMHVFINHGVRTLSNKQKLSVFEMGFGTGLNAFLTLIEAEKRNITIKYTTIEAFPVDFHTIDALEYGKLTDPKFEHYFHEIHQAPWEREQQLSSFFSIEKNKVKLEDIELMPNFFDIVYFDAFGPRAQAELWHIKLLQKMHVCLKTSGILVTYCAKGQVKRDLKEIGFEVYVLPGPPGKREMTRAIKK